VRFSIRWFTCPRSGRGRIPVDGHRGAGCRAQTPPAAASTENPVLTFFKNTELSGFVDTSSYNFNTPAKPCSTVGAWRSSTVCTTSMSRTTRSA
jgi:hypothetical protein